MQLLLTSLLAAAPLVAPVQDSKARAELFVRPADAVGTEVQAAIRIRIDPGWHLYHDDLGPEDAVGKPTRVSFEGADGEWSAVRFPEPHVYDQPYGLEGKPTWINGHEGTIVLYAAGRLADGARAADLKAELVGLTCQDDGSCIPWSASAKTRGAGTDKLFEKFPEDLAVPEPVSEPEQEGETGAQGGFASPLDRINALGGGARAPTEPAEPTGPDEEEHARAELFLRAGADDTVRGVVRIEVDEGYHLFHTDLGHSDATGKPTIVLVEGEGFEWSAVRFPEPEKLDQSIFSEEGVFALGHEGTFLLHFTGEGDGDLADVRVDINGLTCLDDGECVLYDQILASAGEGPDELFRDFPEDLGPMVARDAGTGASGTGSSGTGSGSGSGTGTLSEAEWEGWTFHEYEPRGGEVERSLGLWLVFAFIAGVILNVMPCVLPVVSIKVLSFVQQAGESRARILQLGLAFSAGIIVVFLVLAGLAAFAGQGWGQQFQSEEFLVVMIAIVFGFSLSLFDVYELGVPNQVGQMAAVKREGLVDAFFKGMMATVLATPCSGPFLGSTLTWALAQPALTVFLVFFTVGLGMAAPYVVLTANPGFLKYVPKPGPWMQTFKHLMGFLLLGTVLFLMVSLRQDLLLYTVAFLIFVAMGCWAWGRYATFDQSRVKRLGTVASVLLIVAVGARLSFVDLRNFFAGPGSGSGHLAWVDFDARELQRYHDEGVSVFVDFTADWCLTCKTNEKVVYESDTIVDLLESRGIVAMKADETDNTPQTRAIERLRRQLGANSIPFMAVFPGDDWTRPFTAKDLVTIGQVKEMLEACPPPPNQTASAPRGS